jgi:hypothetical protein
MSEVTGFLSANSDMGASFWEFASRYSSLAEVWADCPRSDWMLWILYKCKYRNTERLEEYVEWPRGQFRQHVDEAAGDQRLNQLEIYKAWVYGQVEADLEAKRITQNGASYRRFTSAWEMALRIIRLLLDEKSTDVKLDNLYERYRIASAGQELHVPNIDETAVRSLLLKSRLIS